MKIQRIVAGLICSALPAVMPVAPSAQAQLLGNLQTASVEEVGANIVGGFLGVTGDYVSVTGQYRRGLASSFDLGAKIAFVDFSSDGGSSVAVNADIKIQLLDVFLHDPIDLSLGPDVTYFQANDITNWYFGGFLILSKEFMLDNQRPLTPYARLGMRLHRVETDQADTDDFDAGFAGGVKYGISGYTSIFGEVVIEDTGSGLYAGAQYQLP